MTRDNAFYSEGKGRVSSTITTTIISTASLARSAGLQIMARVNTSKLFYSLLPLKENICRPRSLCFIFSVRVNYLYVCFSAVYWSGYIHYLIYDTYIFQALSVFIFTSNFLVLLCFFRCDVVDRLRVVIYLVSF